MATLALKANGTRSAVAGDWKEGRFRQRHWRERGAQAGEIGCGEAECGI